MPKYIAGIPTDRWLGFLVRKLRLPVPMARGLLRHIARLSMGNQERFGVPRPEHPIWREHATLSQDLLSYLEHDWVRMKTNVELLGGDHFSFQAGSRYTLEACI